MLDNNDFNFEKIGVIAGSGKLPELVLKRCEELNIEPFVVYFSDNEHSFKKYNSIKATLGEIGKIINFFKTNQVHNLIFAGSVPRPSFSNLSFDSLGIKWMQKLGLKVFAGDDALLKGICELLEQEDFKIISTKNFVPSLVLKPGTYTKKIPLESDLIDIKRGQQVLVNLSDLDIGQACVVQMGIVLGIEGAEGTKELIERCVKLKKDTKGGTIIKMAKISQTDLIDLPTIGLETIKSIINGKYFGIAVSAETTQVMEFEEVVALCNEHEIFLTAI